MRGQPRKRDAVCEQGVQQGVSEDGQHWHGVWFFWSSEETSSLEQTTFYSFIK